MKRKRNKKSSLSSFFRSSHNDSPGLNKSQSVSVSLCMIVKNEEQNIARCLMSVKPVVDEMIVVDTGSTDRTRDIAKAFGAQVYDFTWTDSFADARNFSLSKASGDWILVLDADEVISPLDHEKLRLLVAYSKDKARGDKIETHRDSMETDRDSVETDRDTSRLIETRMAQAHTAETQSARSPRFARDDKEKNVIARSAATRQSPSPSLNKSLNLDESHSLNVSQPVSNLVAFSFITRNYQNPIRLGWVANDGRYPKEEAGTGWVPSVKVRLFPNKRGVRFENPVHEFVESSLSALGIEVVPCDVPVHHYGKLNEAQTASRAEYYYGLGKRKLAEKGESDIQALYEIAVQATELEKYEEALRYWEKVCELKPDFADAFLLLADTYSSLGRYEEAASTAKKAMSLDQNSCEIRASYAKYELFRGHPETAIEELKSLIEADPSYPKALAFLAAAYLIAGKKGECLSYLELLNKTGFHASGFLTDFAKKLIAANRPDFAIALLQAALEHNYETDETRGLLEEAEKHRDS